MKKLFLMAAVIAAAVAARPARAGQNYPDPCSGKLSGTDKTSPLCDGLIEHFPFEETTCGSEVVFDGPAFGSFTSALNEVDGSGSRRIAKIRTALDGSCSLTLESGENAWLWQLGGIPTGSASVAFWFKPESLTGVAGTKYVLLSSDSTNIPGPQVYLEVTNDSLDKAKVCYRNYEQETNTAVSVCSAADSVSSGGVHHVVAGESPYHEGKSRLFLSLDGTTILTTATSYWTRSGIPLLEVGAARAAYIAGPTGQNKYDGEIDQLLLYARPLTQAEITLLYLGGAGRAYPFSTE